MPHPLHAVFAQHDQPSHCGKRDVHDGLRPISALVARMHKQVIEYRAVLAEAHLTDDSLAGSVEHIYQTLGAAEREIAALETAQRNVAKAFTQLDRYMAEQRKSLEGK
jgi:hypothetical protein